MGIVYDYFLSQGTRVLVKHPDGVKIPGKIVGMATQGIVDLYIIEPTSEGLKMLQDKYNFQYTHFAASEGELQLVDTEVIVPQEKEA